MPLLPFDRSLLSNTQANAVFGAGYESILGHGLATDAEAPYILFSYAL